MRDARSRAPALAVCAAVLLVAGSARATPRFFPSTYLPLDGPSPPIWSAACDVDGDGNPDVMGIGGPYNAAVAFVRLGRGDGTLAAPATAPCPGTPRVGAIADLNGDGHPDLVASIPDSDRVVVWLAHADGTLEPPARIQLSVIPLRIAIADVNGDGLPDLLVQEFDPFTVSTENELGVFLGNGDGTFAPQKQSLSLASSMAVGDMDGDGRPDVVTVVGPSAYGHSAIRILWGKGDGTFVPATTTQPAPDYAGPVALADVDGDGSLDVVCAAGPDATSPEIAVLREHHGALVSDTRYPQGSGSYDLVVADLDGDGALDLATADAFHEVGMRFGDGHGGWSGRPVFSCPALSVSAADFDHDGRVDLWAGCGLLRQTAPRLFGEHHAFACGTAPIAVAAGDVNGDGIPDVAVANRDAGTVTILLGAPGGQLVPGTVVTVGGSVRDVALADLDGDGRRDVVAAIHGGSIVTARGHGDGTFATPQAYAVPGTPTCLGVADLDGDGHLDVVTAFDDAPGGNSACSLRNHGDGTLEPAQGFHADPYGIPRLAIGDLSGDGIPDVVTVGRLPTENRGMGNGTFGPPVGLGSVLPYAVALADLDGDGRVDIASVGDASFGAGVELRVQSGRTGALHDYSMGGTGTAVAIADVDGDGVPDLIDVLGGYDVNPYSADLLSIRLGNGDGTFGPYTLYGTEFLPNGIAIADFDGDGRPDLVIPNFLNGTVSLLLNEAGLVDVPRGSTARAPLALEASPMPARGRLELRFTLPTPGRVRLAIHDLLGRRVVTVLDADLPAGPQRRAWSGGDAAGHGVAAGVYFATLETSAGRIVRRLVIAR